MDFKDLRETKPAIPSYNTTVLVRADIALERALCLNEREAETYLRNRITDDTPLKIGRFKINHKDRVNGRSIWETEFTLGGKVQLDKPVPRQEIQKMVSDLTQKVGFSNTNVEVRKAEKTAPEVKEKTPSDRDMVDMSKKVVKERLPQTKHMNREEALRLKRGDVVEVSRSGFREEASILSVDPMDNTVEVRFESDQRCGWLPFTRIFDIKTEGKEEE